MPTLEIRRAGLRPEYAAMTFNYLLGIMLWPVECDARRDFMRTCAAGWKIDLNTAVPGLQSDIELLLNEAIDVPSREFLSQQMRPRLARGCRVGLELARAIGNSTWANPSSTRVSIKRLRADITTPELRKLHPWMDVGEKTLQKDSLEFRQVAHLWGAYQISNFERFDLFRPARLAEFLTLSEYVHARALQVRTSKGDTLITRKVDSWRPPSRAPLPEVTLPLLSTENDINSNS